MCDAPAHAAGAQLAWLGYSTTAGLPGWQQAAGSVLALALSMAPDVDNRNWWRKVDGWVPDEILGAQGPLRHRGITHFWGWPALLGYAAWATPPSVAWVAWALTIGWGSHLLMDFIFGIKPPGVPLLPWWGHVGLGLDSGGRFEYWVALPALVAGSGWLAWGQVPWLRELLAGIGVG